MNNLFHSFRILNLEFHIVVMNFYNSLLFFNSPIKHFPLSSKISSAFSWIRLEFSIVPVNPFRTWILEYYSYIPYSCLIIHINSIIEYLCIFTNWGLFNQLNQIKYLSEFNNYSLTKFIKQDKLLVVL